MLRLRAALLFLLVLMGPAPVFAGAQATPRAEAQTAWRLLDYLAVDYAGSVQGGRIRSASEYAEMKEFAASVEGKLHALPDTSAKATLVEQARSLRTLIASKAAPETVAGSARRLANDLLKAYPTPVAPAAPPSLPRGGELYLQNCSGCHGATGHADGPLAASLNPKPIAFADEGRARQRSLFALHQVIGQGIDGTAMPSFAWMPENDRWALAFYVGGFAYPEALQKEGERLWRGDPAIKAAIPDLASLTQATPAQLAQRLGEGKARAVTAYLRTDPQAFAATPAGSLHVARTRLDQSVEAFLAGDRHKAGDLALSAYLDGFEPVEPILASRDPGLLRRVEQGMAELRASIARGAPAAEIQAHAARISALIDAAERALAPGQASAVSSFTGAFTILLREGIEALLIVVAMLAFLRKADRGEVLPYVHGGWIAALGAGGLTWAAATYVVSISGASRELTEGFGSIVAALVLISVGIWMHGKSRADEWRRYVQEKLTRALSKRSAWFLFLLAFVVVYREVFETILFYAALWSQGGRAALLAGAATAALCLGLLAWFLLSYSRRLPIAQFFAASSLLVAVLAVVLAGKGVAALQEAGLLDITPISGLPRIDVLGFTPSVEAIASQLLTAAILAVGFYLTGRRGAGRSFSHAPGE